MATHPLRAFRPTINRLFGFDQGALCLAIAMVGHWQDLQVLSILAAGLGLAGLAMGTMQIRWAIIRRQQAESAAAAHSNAHSTFAP